MNIDGNLSTKNTAWDVASDPSASEKQWMAACTLLEGKQHPSVRTKRKLPQAVGLPWSLCVSGVSGLGAFMIFGFLNAAVCESLTLITGAYYTFNSAHAFALLGAAFIAYSAIFTYQQHAWGGGRIWSVLHFGLVGIGAILPFSLDLIFNGPYAVSNLVLFSLWGLSFIGLSAVSAKMTKNTIVALEKTVGADRVMPFSRAIFATAGMALLALVTLPAFSSAVTSTWLWLPAVLVGSGFWIAKVNKARNPETASTLALAIWNPLMVANFVLLPALVLNAIISPITFPQSGGVADYAIGLLTMLCLVMGPTLGANLASLSLRRSRELELHHMPVEMLNEHTMPLTRVEDAICEST